MKYKKIEKKHTGKFIHRYDITYDLGKGQEKIYEMISRDGEIDSLERLQKSNPDAVVLILHDESGEKILLNREFRLAAGTWVYNFPAGLLEAGETPEQAAARELKEETGLQLTAIDDVMGYSYSAIGFSNESNLCIVGRAAGQFAESSSAVEEIEAGWFTKEEVRELMKNNIFAARTQAYCYLWSREERQ